MRSIVGHVIGPNNGLYTTGTDGIVTVTGLAPNSTVVVSEKRAPAGYVLFHSKIGETAHGWRRRDLTVYP